MGHQPSKGQGSNEDGPRRSRGVNVPGPPPICLHCTPRCTGRWQVLDSRYTTSGGPGRLTHYSDCCRKISVTLNGFSCCCSRYMQVPCLSFTKKSRVSDQNGVSLLYIMLEIHHSGWEPSDRLVGLVVKASASRAEDPGFEPRLRRDFSGSSHTSDLNIGTPVATLPGAWRYRVSAGTGRPGVSIL